MSPGTGDPLGDMRAPHPLDPDAPSEPLRPGDLSSAAPTAGDYAALARDVRWLITTWRDSIGPMLLRQESAAEALRKEHAATLSQIHNQGRDIDALRKADADLATAHDAQRHMITERVSRTELAIVGIHEILQRMAASAPAAPAPKRRGARKPKRSRRS